MCDVLSGGVPGGVTKCDRGEGGSKLAKNSVTYFMDGPLGLSDSGEGSTELLHMGVALCAGE